MSCKICGQSYHYCSSCDSYLTGDYGCCSYDCLRKDEDVKKLYYKFKSLNFTEEQLNFVLEDCADELLQFFINDKSFENP